MSTMLAYGWSIIANVSRGMVSTDNRFMFCLFFVFPTFCRSAMLESAQGISRVYHRLWLMLTEMMVMLESVSDALGLSMV